MKVLDPDIIKAIAPLFGAIALLYQPKKVNILSANHL